MKLKTLSLDLRVLLGVLVAFAVGVFLVTALFGLFNPRDTSQPEGAVVAGAMRVAHGEPLFLDIRRGPYVTAMYGPFIYITLGGLVKLFGAGITGAYLLGRVLSLLSAIACAAMVAGLSRRCGANSFGAWIAGGLFLASPVILPVAYSTKRPAGPCFASKDSSCAGLNLDAISERPSTGGGGFINGGIAATLAIGLLRFSRTDQAWALFPTSCGFARHLHTPPPNRTPGAGRPSMPMPGSSPRIWKSWGRWPVAEALACR
jgi:hypothetical protein